MRGPLNKAAQSLEAAQLRRELDHIQHAIRFEIEGVLTDRELELWDLKALRLRLSELLQERPL